MLFFAYILLALYALVLTYVTLYCLVQLDLLRYYLRYPGQSSPAPVMPAGGVAVPLSSGDGRRRGARAGREGSILTIAEDEAWPFVTIQLPIYNEQYVVERLIDNIIRIDYPPDRFEIHILDDSTDETVELTRRKVDEYQAQGFSIRQIRRPVRQGYKAGALRDAMPLARGEYIAIFDADFLPRPDFLRQTLPYFQAPGVGVVQTRWEHINEDYSLLTRLQAMHLNVHFTVEQTGRMAGQFLLQFNGTAGVWRREAIDDAGGWEADTLTEDLDLSIRAQLRGWKIHYLERVGSPAELPVDMGSIKSQQFRWMKGGAETARKMMPAIWRSGLGFHRKMQAVFHLLASTIFVFVLLLGVLSVPLLLVFDELIAAGFNRDHFIYFLAGLLSIIAVYFVANGRPWVRQTSMARYTGRFLFLFPLFLAFSMGLSLHNAVAVIQGYLGRKSPFVRTPKFNIRSIRDSFLKNRYRSRRISWTTFFEGLLALYFLGAVSWAVVEQNFTFIIFHAMLALGYGGIFLLSLRDVVRD